MIFFFHHISFVEPAAGLFEGDLFADAPLPQSTLPPGAMTSRTDSDDDMDHFDVGAPSPNPRYFFHVNKTQTPKKLK